MSGLELMQAMIEGTLPKPSITDTIPMRPIEARRGYTKFRAQADGRHLNPFGGVCGGFAATVLDSVTASAVHTMLDSGVGVATIDLNVKMLKAIPVDVELTAEGKVIHLAANFGVAEGFIRSAEGALYAHATATCAIIR
jgi:uncharacterized protein (TIGR00369 family)